ncbi:MAG: hypothetical protein ABI672_21225 [Vicinamibacteria bacterium]
MNATKQNDQPSEQRDSRAVMPRTDTLETETQAAKESNDFRETPEGGYGWGV